jgi:hypothetical protein
MSLLLSPVQVIDPRLRPELVEVRYSNDFPAICRQSAQGHSSARTRVQIFPHADQYLNE